MHFARRHEGPKTPLPCFRGIRGPDIVRSLLEIEVTFEKNLQILKDVRKTILDVKVPTKRKLLSNFPRLLQSTSLISKIMDTKSCLYSLNNQDGLCIV